jgi:ElaB/YqjD/DUF883 family membrane-anchored ribosome-binding protein
VNIAKALNMEAYQLLTPIKSETETIATENNRLLEQITELIDDKKIELRKIADKSMEELKGKIIKLYGADSNRG